MIWGCQREQLAVCPQGYVSIPQDKSLEIDSFCLMRFEAKKSKEGKPSSTPLGLPWVEISFYEAKEACQSLGERYDLISNREWLAVANNLYRQRKNWTGWLAGRGQLIRGHSEGLPFKALDVQNSRDEFDQIIFVNDKKKNYLRRTLYLSTGEAIWDFSGNTWSWVDWTRGSQAKLGPVGCLPGPFEFDKIDLEACNDISYEELKREHIIPMNKNSDQGVGTFQGSYGLTGGAPRRGGHRSDGKNAGIYSLSLTYPPHSQLSYIGFRCVYRP